MVKYLNNSEQSEAITEYITSQQAKRPRRAATHASVSHLRLQSCVTEACDTITEEVKEYFGFSDIFHLFYIVNVAEFELYRNSFPDNYFKEIASNYTMLNKDKLKCELSVLYANDNFSGISNISELIKFINENGLDETFSEVSKLLEIVLVTLFFFYLYIYPPDSQESDGGAIHKISNYPDLLPEMPRYCCPLVI